jgi:hypothetical protein
MYSGRFAYAGEANPESTLASIISSVGSIGGIELTDDELNSLTEDYPEELYEMALESLF